MNLIPYIGIPYAVRGIPPAAADCWSLVRWFAKQELKEDWPDYMYDVESYMKHASRHILREMKELGTRWKQEEKPTFGSLLVFRMSGHPTHCAVYLGHDDMLHTLQGRMSCVEHMPNWEEQLIGAYRWLG